MKHLKPILYGIFIIFLTVTCRANNNPSLAPMLGKVMPAIVNISVRGEIPADILAVLEKQRSQNNTKIDPRFESAGSGIIIDAEHGYIITNAHVIKDARTITITLSDNRSMTANVLGYDIFSDIAVLQINAKRLKNAIMGNSDNIKVGDFVCTIGSPFGLQQSVASGVVSGLERSDPTNEGFESFIQTDAAVNMGSSGGALVNMQGEVIGINTALIGIAPTNAGVGLAIPSNIAKNVAEQIIKYGKVKRGVVGLLVQDMTSALYETLRLKEYPGGVLISQVMEGSPAATVGLRAKDVIVKIMDKPAHSAIQVRNITNLSLIGSKIKLQILRDNKLMNFEPTIIYPENLKKNQDTTKNILAGLGLKNLDILIDNQQIKGIEVLYVDDTSAAYSCGLRPTDIILNVANQPVTSITELQTIANKNSKQLLLEIKRGLIGNVFLVLEE